jgi:hypothetical protein
MLTAAITGGFLLANTALTLLLRELLRRTNRSD